MKAIFSVKVRKCIVVVVELFMQHSHCVPLKAVVLEVRGESNCGADDDGLKALGP